MKVGKIQLFKNNPKQALHNLYKASDILKITHGEDNDLYENELVPLLIQAASESDPNDSNWIKSAPNIKNKGFVYRNVFTVEINKSIHKFPLQ